MINTSIHNSHDDQYIFLIVTRLIRRMKNVSDKTCREYQNTHFILNKLFFFKNLTIQKIMWKNIVEPDRPQVTGRRMRVACWVP